MATSGAGEPGREGHRLQRFPLRVWAEPDVGATRTPLAERYTRFWNAAR